MASQRAKWSARWERGLLVDVLLDYRFSHYRGQNGWCSEGWNRIVRDVNKMFPDAKLTKSQIQDKEAQFKKDYKAIKSIVNRSGISWDPITFMINTTDEKWDEIIEEEPKLKKYQKSYPLYDSLDQLYEGQFAEGKHCFTSLAAGNKITSRKPPRKETQQVTRRKDALASQVLHTETFHDGRENIHGLERDEAMGRSYGHLTPQGLHEEYLDDEDVDADIQATRSEEPSNSRRSEESSNSISEEPSISRRSKEPSNSRSADGGTHGRPKKRKDGSVPCLEETMSAYVDLKRAQSSFKEQAITQGQEYSMSRCFEVLHLMTDVSDEIMIHASDVFKDPVNCEIFICYESRLRGLWLKKEVAKLNLI